MILLRDNDLANRRLQPLSHLSLLSPPPLFFFLFFLHLFVYCAFNRFPSFCLLRSFFDIFSFPDVPPYVFRKNRSTPYLFSLSTSLFFLLSFPYLCEIAFFSSFHPSSFHFFRPLVHQRSPCYDL